MTVKIIKDLEDYFVVNYEIKKGDKFEVKYSPDKFTNSKGVTKTGYLICSTSGRPIIVYDDEVEVTD